MDRSTFLTESRQKPVSISFSPKGDTWVSIPDELSFPLEAGAHPFAIFDGQEFFFSHDRFYLYGYSKGVNYYSTSYNKKEEEITVYARESGQGARNLGAMLPEEAKTRYRMATGVLVTAAAEFEGDAFLIDLKFQASSRGNWIDYTSECRRKRQFPDFKLSMEESEDFGHAFFFKQIKSEPSAEIKALLDNEEVK